MDPTLLKQVLARVYKRYPEFAGLKPKVRIQAHPQGRPASDTPSYLLTFKGTVSAKSATGPKMLPRYLRIVVDQQGNIIKASTSR